MAEYMLIMRGTDESIAAMMDTPFEQMLETMGRINDEMIKAGVLLAAEGLDDPSQGVVVDFSGETPVVTDGPYGETKELFGGFYLLDVATKEEAVDGPSACRAFPARSARSAACRRSTSSRRTTSGSSRSARGASARASSDARRRLAGHRGGAAGRRGRLADRVRQDRRRAGPLHRGLRAGRGRRAGGGGRGARHLVPRGAADVLALMFMACHPVLSPEARVALTLRAVGGLSSEEIARAFLVPVPTVQARITRAKKTIAAAAVPFELPPAEQRRERLGGILSVLYVIFTEGSTATAGDSLLRTDLAYEAIRLARMLVSLQPGEPEVHGLLALFELTAARFPARTGPDGEAVLLEDQDRRLWDRSAIRRGQAAVERASALGRGLGPYGLQAAIAACHAAAASVPETDWERIVLLYEALGRVAPSPVVELNRAVAVAMAHGPRQALALVDELAASARLSGSHLLPSVRGELLARLGRTDEARAELELAARLCGNVRERRVLLRKAGELHGP